MGRAYGAKEFSVRFGMRDQSDTAVGTQSSTDAHTNDPVSWRLNGINDIAWDAGYNRSELSRSGLRGHRNADIINHYGSGSWTWDFDYTVDNELAIQHLMQMIYPSNGVTTTALTIPANPTVESYAHGVQGDVDSTADIIISNPDTDEDRFMHSAILQNLTLSMAAGTNAGVLNASGQFYTGYKPGIADYDSLLSSPNTAVVSPPRGLFDCTVHTVGGTAVSVDSFSVTLSNPAVRTGYQGSSGEADGYVRASTFEVTGSITLKADDYVMSLLNTWQSNTTVAIVMEAGTASELSFSIPAANMSGVNLSLNDEGNMIEIPFRATSGAGSGNLLVMKYT